MIPWVWQLFHTYDCKFPVIMWWLFAISANLLRKSLERVVANCCHLPKYLRKQQYLAVIDLLNFPKTPIVSQDCLVGHMLLRPALGKLNFWLHPCNYFATHNASFRYLNVRHVQLVVLDLQLNWAWNYSLQAWWSISGWLWLSLQPFL